jgi:hypothetical protein
LRDNGLFHFLFRRIRKALFLVLPLGLVGIYAVHEASGSSTGVAGYSRTGCSGGSCHGARSAATVIHISTTAPQIVAGKTYVFSISVANPSELAAGCDITTSSGATLSLNGPNSGLQVTTPYYPDLTHTGPNQFGAADSAVWTFKYTAPQKVGTAYIYAACNAVNLNGHADAGDHWNTIIDTLKVVSASEVETDDQFASGISISPNPTPGVVMMRAMGLSGAADIQVTDAAGRIVHRESVILGAETPLDLSALQNGSYFVAIRTGTGETFTKRIVIDK